MAHRKYFLDWMRVLAFALLILFHTGMLYVGWRYNLTSPRVVPGLDWAMIMLTPWRMALIFLISGVACRFLIDRLGPGRFALDRFMRLQPPILVGMFIIIPPQTYVQLLANGLTDASYLDFWWNAYLKADQTLVRPLGKTMPTWDHLWFLVYLFVYAEGLALWFALSGKGRRGDQRPAPLALLLTAPTVVLVLGGLVVAFLAPRTDGLVDDWGSHICWLGMFLTGTVVAFRDDFWSFLSRRWGGLALLTAILGGGVLALHALYVRDAMNPQLQKALWAVAAGLYGWSMILTLAGLAAAFLNRGSARLTYLNQAILPVYVLHQPILLVAAFWLFPLQLPLPLEAAILAGLAGPGSLALYHLLIRPFGPMRFLFGVRRRSHDPRPNLEPA